LLIGGFDCLRSTTEGDWKYNPSNKVDDEKASLPVLHSWIDPFRMWDRSNAIRAACSNFHAVTGFDGDSNTHPANAHRHTPTHHSNLHIHAENVRWLRGGDPIRVEHPEILTPLGSNYHGWQSHIYMPGDGCLFR